MHPLTDVWWRLFINRTDGTIRSGRDGWVYTPQEVTIEELEAALQLRQSLGVYSVDTEGMSRWGCLDADTADGLEVLVAVATGLNPVTTLFELSRRGGHLWWFCPPTAWQQVQAVGRTLVKDHPDIEVFPKGRGRSGVRLPNTRHPGTGQVYPIVNPATGEVRAVEELMRLQVEPLPQLQLPQVQPEPLARSIEPGDFYELLREVNRWTRVRVYAPERAVGHCPFHDDRRPSLSLLGGFWRCWAGCGEGGVNAFRAKARERGLEVRENGVSTTQ